MSIAVLAVATVYGNLTTTLGFGLVAEGRASIITYYVHTIAARATLFNVEAPQA